MPQLFYKNRSHKVNQLNHSRQTLAMPKFFHCSLSGLLSGLNLIDGGYENKKNKIIKHFRSSAIYCQALYLNL